MSVVRNGEHLRAIAAAVDFRDDAVEILRPVADQGAELPDACLRRIVRWHIGVRTTLDAIGAPPRGSLPERLAAYAEEVGAKITALEGLVPGRRGDLERVTGERDDALAQVEALAVRRDELLATVARVSQQTPFPEELEGWPDQRAKMLAEIGTLRARVQELETAQISWSSDVARRRKNADELHEILSRVENERDDVENERDDEIAKCTAALRQRDEATDELIKTRAALATEQYEHRATIVQRDHARRELDDAIAVLRIERDGASAQTARRIAVDEEHEDAINAVRIELQGMTDALRIERAERKKDRECAGAVLDREMQRAGALVDAIADIRHNANRHVVANIGALARVIYGNGLLSAHGEDTIGVLMKCGAFHAVAESLRDGFVAALAGAVDDYARDHGLEEPARVDVTAPLRACIEEQRKELARVRAAGVPDPVFEVLGWCHTHIGAALDDCRALDDRTASVFARLYDDLGRVYEPMQRARIAAAMPACSAGKVGCILKGQHEHVADVISDGNRSDGAE